ncbi:cyclin-dependent kinase 1-like [Contarinia nasturtii]|uniref:cyclin-dependent kinase 1-like n=1 Tax=Contarinia nasturtii TaxID=265458 RepID=UPI0012D38A97|nr:cyclin-dependent kinase 1-like [Contarinia nasturtii]
MDYIKILKKMGKNSNHVFYKGAHILTKKLFILKEHKKSILEEGIPAAAIREISLLKELKHPNIISLQNIFVNAVTVTLSFEYIPMDLKTYMIRLPKDFVFPQAVIQSYLYQIASGIAHCHQRRIFHRNLCPQNILIKANGVIKITEFEAARSFEITSKVYTHNVTMLWYRSPEILLGTSQYSPKIDIWSMGCIFAELFQRKPIFNGDSEIGQLHKIAEILGAPDKNQWPEVVSLPYYFAGLRINTQNRLKMQIKNAKNIEIYLMKQMLKCNPMNRISAKGILDHQYFSNFNKNLRIPTII